MYQRSLKIIPLVKSCRCSPAFAQSRNIWDLTPINFRSAIRNMERQMDNFEREFFRSPLSPLRIMAPRFMPIEGKEANKDSSYRINIDVQGFKPEDIKISLKEGTLKIEAHMEKTAEDGSKFQQSIVREFTLPSNIEKSSMKSLLHEDGILSIEAQLSEQNQPKDIPIQQVESGDKPKV